jgi:hypothetical protein
MTSRDHTYAGWLSSLRSQIMADSIGLGERDSRWGGETYHVLGDVQRKHPPPDPMSPEFAQLTRTARIAALNPAFDLRGLLSSRSLPN